MAISTLSFRALDLGKLAWQRLRPGLAALLLMAVCPRVVWAVVGQSQTATFLGVTTTAVDSTTFSGMGDPLGLYSGPGGVLFFTQIYGPHGSVGVVQLNRDGTILPNVPNQAAYPDGITADGNGDLLVVDFSGGGQANQLWSVPWSLANGFGTPTGIQVPLPAQYNPLSVAVDSAGDLLVGVSTTDASGVFTGSILERPGPLNELFRSTSPTNPPSGWGVLQIYDNGSSSAFASGTFPGDPNQLVVQNTPNDTFLYIAGVAGFGISPPQILPWVVGQVGSSGNGTLLALPPPLPSIFANKIIGVAMDASGIMFVMDGLGTTASIAANGGATLQIAGQGAAIPNAPNAINGTFAAAGLAVNQLGALFIGETDPFSSAAGAIWKYQYGAVDFGAWPTGPNPAPKQTLVLPFQVSDPGSTALVVSLETQTVPSTGGEVAEFQMGNPTVDTTTTPATLSVPVTFIPGFAGLRKGVLNVYDSRNHLLTTLPLFGTGQEPRPVFTPSAAPMVLLGDSTALPVATPGPLALGPGLLFVGNLGANNVLAVPMANLAVNPAPAAVDTTPVALGGIAGLAVDGGGTLYISDPVNDQIVLVNPNQPGSATALTVNQMGQPGALATDAAGNLFIIDNQPPSTIDALVWMVPHGLLGSPSPVDATAVATPGIFLKRPCTGIAVDGDENLYIDQAATGQVVLVPGLLGGPALQLALPPGLFQSMAVDPTGDLYLADPDASQILMVPAGQMASLPGSAMSVPLPGLTSPGLSSPGGLAVNERGGLFIADSGNNRVLVLDRSTPGSLLFPYTQAGSQSSPELVQLTNIGNQPLVFTDATVPTAFQEDPGNTTIVPNSTSGGSLAQGATGKVAVIFSPVSGGPVTGTFTLTDNAFNRPGNVEGIPLRGNDSTSPDSTALALQVTPTSVGTGQAITMTALVSDTARASVIPTGTVTFTDTYTDAQSNTVTRSLGSGVVLDGSGTAIQAETLVDLGVHTINASFTSPDGSFGPSTPAHPITVTVFHPVTVSLASSANPSTSGAPVTFTATVVGNGRNPPSGNVIFYDPYPNALGTPPYTVGLDANGQATFTTPSGSPLAVGSHTITSRYQGDNSFYAPGTSPALIQVVTGGNAIPTVSLASSVNPSSLNQAVTFTATVTGLPGTTPTGTVAFSDGTTALGSPTLTAGVTTLTTASLASGSHSITAAYGGDANYSGSSAALNQTVKAATTTALTASLNPANAGQAVLFTATVTSASGTTPTGTVTFMDGAIPLGSPTLTAGVATLTTSSLATGSHGITATYSGDGNDAGSTGTLTEVVTASTAAPSVTLTSHPDPSRRGETVALSATVSAGAGNPVPTGTVAFKDGSTVLATRSLNAAGSARFSTADLGPGKHDLTAAYGGDASYPASASMVLVQTVLEFAHVRVRGEPDPSALLQPVTFTVRVEGRAGTPTGTVSLSVDGTPVAADLPLLNGEASFTTASLRAGEHRVEARYSGDGVYAPAHSRQQRQFVHGLQATVSLHGSPNPALAGKPVTFSTTVTGSGPTPPTGTVSFRDESRRLGSVPQNHGTASLTSSTGLPRRNHLVVAIYSGDASYATAAKVLLEVVH